jgi:hypothetical protein
MQSEVLGFVRRGATHGPTCVREVAAVCCCRQQLLCLQTEAVCTTKHQQLSLRNIDVQFLSFVLVFEAV